MQLSGTNIDTVTEYIVKLLKTYRNDSFLISAISHSRSDKLIVISEKLSVLCLCRTSIYSAIFSLISHKKDNPNIAGIISEAA